MSKVVIHEEKTDIIPLCEIDRYSHYIGVQDGSEKYILVNMCYESRFVLVDLQMDQSSFVGTDFDPFVESLILDRGMEVFAFESIQELMRWFLGSLL